KIIRNWAPPFYSSLSNRKKIMSYLIAATIGAGTFSLYWFVITKALTGRSTEGSSTRMPREAAEKPAASRPISPSPDLSAEILRRLEELQRNLPKDAAAPAFLISSGPAMVADKAEQFLFFVSPELPTQAAVGPIGIEPVNLFLYVGVLNQQSVPTIIQGFKVE